MPKDISDLLKNISSDEEEESKTNHNKKLMKDLNLDDDDDSDNDDIEALIQSVGVKTAGKQYNSNTTTKGGSS